MLRVGKIVLCGFIYLDAPTPIRTSSLLMASSTFDCELSHMTTSGEEIVKLVFD